MINVLSGLKVIDASTVLAGPSVGTFFAELGAEVIKVEHPVHGDVTRTWKSSKESSTTDVSAYFSSVNYRKSYLKLDLSNPTDREQFLELIRDADVLLTNFKKGDAEKFAIEDAVLQALNHRLIIGKINGYGEDSDRVAYDLILQAESGFMSMNGTSESGPVKMPVALIDVLAAHQLKEALLLALFDRERSGKGRSVSVSLYAAAVSSLVNQASNYLMSGLVAERQGSLHPNIAPYGEIFHSKDRALITFAIGSDVHFRKLCNALRLEHLLEDDRFSDNQQRVIHRTALSEVIAAACVTWNSSELLELLEAMNVPAGKIRSLDEVFKDPVAQTMIREELIENRVTKRVSSIAFTWKQ